MFRRRRGLWLLHPLRWFLPRLPHHLRARGLLLLHLRVWWFCTTFHLWTFLAPWWWLHDWPLFAFNLLRHALHFRTRHFTLHLLLSTASYALTLHFLSLLFALRLLRLLSCSLRRPLFIHLLFSLLLLELAHLSPRILVTLRRLRGQIGHLLSTRRVLLVGLSVHLSGLPRTTNLLALTLIP